jgi:hypothetical protein
MLGSAFDLPVELLLVHARALLIIMSALAPAAAGWLIIEAYYYQTRRRPSLERDLGFQYGTSRGKIVIASVTAGGPFSQAGFSVGDVIVDEVTITGFLRNLERARGRGPITIRVACARDYFSGVSSWRALSVHVPARIEPGVRGTR